MSEKNVKLSRIGGPLKCVFCTGEQHQDCYNDGVCECSCKYNKNRRKI